MSTIYDMQNGYTITDGLQSQKVCDETIRTARRLAHDLGHSVIVDDPEMDECYRITPAGHRWKLPKEWQAAIDAQNDREG